MNKKVHRTAFLPFAASLTLGLLSQAATAATMSTSVTIPVTAGSGYSVTPATGLAQFDPANGTLTGIALGLDISSYDLTLSLNGWDDPETGAQFQYTYLSAQISIDAATPGGGGLLFSSTVVGDVIFDEFDTINVSGSSGGPEIEDATTRLSDASLFTNFIGTGDVSILSLGIYSFGYPRMVTLDDGTSVGGDPYIDNFNVGPSILTIDYTYTPTAVPVPAAIWLLGSGLLGLAGFKRRTV